MVLSLSFGWSMRPWESMRATPRRRRGGLPRRMDHPKISSTQGINARLTSRGRGCRTPPLIWRRPPMPGLNRTALGQARLQSDSLERAGPCRQRQGYPAFLTRFATTSRKRRIPLACRVAVENSAFWSASSAALRNPGLCLAQAEASYRLCEKCGLWPRARSRSSRARSPNLVRGRCTPGSWPARHPVRQR
jgi:hypothetical protein